MNYISLISDRKPGDFFLGRLKGHLYKNISNLEIIDFATGLDNFNITSGAFILKSGFDDFPENTIHIIGLDSELSADKALLVAKAQNQYFVFADNGIITLIFDSTEIENVVKVNCEEFTNYRASLFYFADVAKRILNGEEYTELGTIITNYKRRILFKPSFGSNFLAGNIIYFDSYKNGITNIDLELFEAIRKGRKYIIYAGSKKDYVTELSKNYNSVEDGEIVALFNSYKLLEIAINKGNLKTLFNLSNNAIIRIEFYD